jgi:predicted ATP-grasp superfamily ATP-dependent carboligase
MTVARHWGELSHYYYGSFPSWDILKGIMDKQVQITAAQDAGVGVPRTVFLDAGTSVDLSAVEVGWPAVLKGRSGKGFARALGRQVLLVNSPEEAEAARERFGEYDLLLQEIIPGDDDHLYTYGSYMAPSGQPLASFTGRKLRQRPPGFGVAIAAESLDLPDLADEGLRLLRALRFFGPSQVEFKHDPRDGRHKLMEVNARFWSWHGLATFCGANIAYATYCNALGQPVEPQVASGHKGWILWLYDLMLTGRRVMQGRYSLGRWLRALPLPMMDGIFDPDDPVPALLAAPQLVRQGIANISDRLIRGRQRPIGGSVSAGDLGLAGRAKPDDKRP